MGKLMVTLTRFLSLCAVLLALPTIAAAQPNLQPTGITFDTGFSRKM
jgi:hypothetical protein